MKDMFKLIEDIYTNATSRFHLDEQRRLGDCKIGREVRLGDMLSPKVFTTATEAESRSEDALKKNQIT